MRQLKASSILFSFLFILSQASSVATARCGGVRLSGNNFGNLDDDLNDEVFLNDDGSFNGNQVFLNGNGSFNGRFNRNRRNQNVFNQNGQVFLNTGQGGFGGFGNDIFDPGNAFGRRGFGNGIQNGFFDDESNTVSQGFGRSLRNQRGPGMLLRGPGGSLVRVAGDRSGNLIDSAGRRIPLNQLGNSFGVDSRGNLVELDGAGNIIARNFSMEGIPIRPVPVNGFNGINGLGGFNQRGIAGGFDGQDLGILGGADLQSHSRIRDGFGEFGGVHGDGGGFFQRRPFVETNGFVGE